MSVDFCDEDINLLFGSRQGGKQLLSTVSKTKLTAESCKKIISQESHANPCMLGLSASSNSRREKSISTKSNP
jgi:hypothetical protein